jgi:hypothetical protein
MKPFREYKTGARWAFWRWTFTPSGYLTRLHLVKTPWFAVCLHWINGPDEEPWLHDHPVSFFSVVLRGGYFELRDGGAGTPSRDGWRLWVNAVRAGADDRHRIHTVIPRTLTLAIMGPVRRRWGFHTPDGWVDWRDYNAATYGGAP